MVGTAQLWSFHEAIYQGIFVQTRRCEQYDTAIPSGCDTFVQGSFTAANSDQ
jgi:hypothetical protein